MKFQKKQGKAGKSFGLRGQPVLPIKTMRPAFPVGKKK